MTAMPGSCLSAEQWEQLVHEHHQMVFASAMRVLGNASDAEDATQETFQKLLTQRTRIRCNTAAWLHRCAHSTAVDFIRRQGRRREREYQAGRQQQRSATIYESDTSEDPRYQEARERAQDVLDQCLAALVEEERQLLLQYHFYQRSQRQLASDLAISQPAVIKRLNRALQHLRYQLRQRGVPISSALLISLLARPAAAITASNSWTEPTSNQGTGHPKGDNGDPGDPGDKAEAYHAHSTGTSWSSLTSSTSITLLFTAATLSTLCLLMLYHSDGQETHQADGLNTPLIIQASKAIAGSSVPDQSITLPVTQTASPTSTDGPQSTPTSASVRGDHRFSHDGLLRQGETILHLDGNQNIPKHIQFFVDETLPYQHIFQPQRIEPTGYRIRKRHDGLHFPRHKDLHHQALGMMIPDFFATKPSSAYRIRVIARIEKPGQAFYGFGIPLNGDNFDNLFDNPDVSHNLPIRQNFVVASDLYRMSDGRWDFSYTLDDVPMHRGIYPASTDLIIAAIEIDATLVSMTIHQLHEDK